MQMDSRSASLRRTAALHRPSTEFYPRLESLRGLAALMVAGFHCFQSAWLDSAGVLHDGLVGWPTRTGERWDVAGLVWAGLWNGEGAVIIFFVISGFVLSGSLMREGRGFASLSLSFALARIFRIYPAAFATIAFFALAFWASGAALGDVAAYSPWQLLCNALLIQTDINGVMWTLQVELIAVPLLLAVFLGWRSWGLSVPVTILAALTILLFYKPWSQTFPFGRHIVAFMPGVLVFLFGRTLAHRLSPNTAQGLFVLSTVSFFAGIPIVGFWNAWTIVIVMTLGAIIVALLAYAPLGGIGRLFDIPIVRFYGRISYSFYLLHPLTLLVTWHEPEKLGAIVQAGVPPGVVGCVLFIVSVATIAPVAWCSYVWIERPGVLAGRRVVQLLGLIGKPVPVFPGHALPTHSPD
jgi:peptidoglycan/LPS O-acetylase OafA/YrhL